MHRALLYILTLGLLAACNDGKQCDIATSHISGEVVNPTGEYIIFSQNGTIIDSVALDKNNRFSFTHDNLKSGLYSFWHNEFQAFYLQPGDSIVFRVNTIDFDESLHFSGNGSKKNNLLTKLYLQTERANKNAKLFVNETPAIYTKKLDSLYQENQKLLMDYVESANVADSVFKEVALANLTYSKYLQKELYVSSLIKDETKNVSEVIANLPQDFLAHRKEAITNNPLLQLYFPYYRFLNSYFDNLAFEQYKKTDSFDRKNYLHSKHKMEMIDAHKLDSQMRNILLKNTASSYLAHTKNEKQELELLDHFLALNTNKQHHEEIKELAQVAVNHIPGKVIPNIQLVNVANEVKTLHNTISKPTVFYFWSYASLKNNKDLHLKARELAAKYPEYDFIGINIDTNFRKWQRTVVNFKYDVVKEYQLEDKISTYKQLYINSSGKAIIVDKQGEIIHGHTSLNSFEIENLLLGNLNV